MLIGIFRSITIVQNQPENNVDIVSLCGNIFKFLSQKSEVDLGSSSEIILKFPAV